MKKLTVLGQDVRVRVSPTFLQNAACPLNLKLTYVDKVEDHFLRVSTIRGSAAHEAIADLTKMAVDEEMPFNELTDDDVIAAVQKHTPHEIYAELGNILRWVRLWRDRYQYSKDLVGFEERLAVYDTPNWDEAPWDEADIRGILDWIEINNVHRHCIITDYKSRAGILSQGELDAHEQLSFYAWLVSKFYPHVETFTVRIWYLQYGFAGETSRTAQQIADYEDQMRLQIAKVLDIQSWDPIPGDHCGVCNFIHMCPVAKDLGPVPPEIISQTQAVEAASRIRVMEVLTSEMKKKLRKYVVANDAVRIGGDFVYGFKAHTSKAWDVRKVQEVLQRFGMDLPGADIVNLDKRKITKLIKSARNNENEELADALEELAYKETSTDFKGYKALANEDDEE
jgi:hypothetical protein